MSDTKRANVFSADVVWGIVMQVIGKKGIRVSEASKCRKVRGEFDNAEISDTGMGIGLEMRIYRVSRAGRNEGVERRLIGSLISVYGCWSHDNQYFPRTGCGDYPHFREAVGLCEEHGIKVADSNPRLELWMILHEKEYPSPTTAAVYSSN